ncbi:branched-chain amino acid aminotransferase [Desulfoluna spongiiphila]|uniref:Branched-chain-amino-acid aminotransferase n=1 Tax=Desulfoluna spongiiphila TaxID=419481 RepID=A0A1G5DZ18_9BACT|nr:branched-chain amino acid aminotransferase [Desulfoluna spongiiphila]SCY19964.1 branched chain amino acid aminotransferase apoenzyme [Desulfoluna spongiiphila]VVS91501.1 branched-chain amino acid aminotransferase ii [Desulfoluna spongiiphila]
MDITINKIDTPKAHPDEANLGFGTIFTDHMFVMDYTEGIGWHDARITPYGPFEVSPATMVLHYGQTIFEGLKVYKKEDGSAQLFRPKDNFERLNRSAHALCIPEINVDDCMEALHTLLEMEKGWIPSAPGTTLYVRPFIIAMDPYIGLKSSPTHRFMIILSPVGAYYPEGFNPVKIWVSPEHVRAVRGGLGAAKTAANYAASLYATEIAQAEGYTQVLWLDGVERKYVEEVGSMNIFFVIDDEIVTPELNGSILAGITRDSVLKLAKHQGKKVAEKRISIDEVFKAHEEGRLQECFGSGTAAVISPVNKIKFGDREITVGDGGAGPISSGIFNDLMDIQFGRSEDPLNWIVPVK